MNFDKFIFEDKNKLLLYFLIIIVIIFGLVHLYIYIKNTNSNSNSNNKNYISEKFDVELNSNQNLGTSNVIFNSLDNIIIKYKNNSKLSEILMNYQTDLNNLITSNISVLKEQYLNDIIPSLQSNIDKTNTEIEKVNRILDDSITNVNSNISLNIPAYSIIAYYPIGNKDSINYLPFGWQICNGATLLTVNKIGTDIQTPNLQSRFILGSGTGSSLTPRVFTNIGGEENVKLETSQIPNHYHVLMFGGANFEDYDNDPGQGWKYGRSGQNTINGTAPVRLTMNGQNSGMSTEGASVPHNNMPPYYVLIYIIKQPL